MPAESDAQRKAAGMALAAKRGQISPSRLKGSALSMFRSMSAEQLSELAHKPS